MNWIIEISRSHQLKLIIAFLVVVILTEGSCNKNPVLDCFTSTGEIIQKEREIGYFHTIELNDNINLILNQSSQNNLILESGENLMKNIVTEVTSDSVLVIRNDNKCNWVRSYDKPINIYLDFKRLDKLEYRSIGDVVNTDTIRLDSIQINVYEGAGKIDMLLKTFVCQANMHYGTADIVLRGISIASIFYQVGAGKIDARELENNQVYMRNWGSNDMFVWSKEFLSVEIKGLGNVYYYGNPGIDANLIGEGQLIKLSN